MTASELAATYDRIANDYTEDHKNDTWSLAMVERFVQLLPKRARVLDVGCGSGWETRRFARAGFRIREEVRYVKRKPGKRPWLQFIVERR